MADTARTLRCLIVPSVTPRRHFRLLPVVDSHHFYHWEDYSSYNITLPLPTPPPDGVTYHYGCWRGGAGLPLLMTVR